MNCVEPVLLVPLTHSTVCHNIQQTPCLTESCANGGSCVAKYEENKFKCVCLPGYTGRSCDKGRESDNIFYKMEVK